ncbi:hypothetical protein CCMA1212_010722 [Trichoderma ghanense]|uniref:Uncharacterized protein n=1 Tax=Trichoderma ghanense TaxID=65468 RepID=A0ABY2GRG4_9HYPO
MAARQPSLEEALLYYYDGISACPKLIARSSNLIWDFAPRMSIPLNATTHPLLVERLFFPPASNGDDGDGDDRDSLLYEILDILLGYPMVAIAFLHTCTRNQNWQTVLVVDVKPGRLTWAEGYELAWHCKAVMHEHGIFDVECEVREALGGDDDDDGQVAKLWHDVSLAFEDDVDDIADWM